VPYLPGREHTVVLFSSMSDTTTWNEYCEASLDLSNQDDVGEAGAIAALDQLYANNDEGMKRLADDGYPKELGDFVIS